MIRKIAARPGRQRDYTSGSLHRSIWSLAIPMILEMGVMSVYQLVDIFWVSRLGSTALAAATIGLTLRWAINSTSNGLGIGGMAVVARRIGGGEEARAGHATWQTILLALLVSAMLGTAGIAAARPTMRLFGASAEVLAIGAPFLQILFGSMFTLVLVFVINSLLRGAGEAGWAMWVFSLSTVLTVTLEPLLIFGWGPLPALGLNGSAWAGAFGLGFGLLLQMALLLSGRIRIAINFHNLWPDLPLMWHIIKIALPGTMQMFLRSSSRLVILGIIGLYGTFAIAGFGVANRILLIALIPGFGLANAASTLVGQNLGAEKPERAEHSAWWVTAYNFTLLTTLALVSFFFARPLISFFDSTPEVVEVGVECLRIVAPSLVFSAIGVVMGRSLDGAGNTMPPMMVNLLTLWGMEAPLSYGLARWVGLGVTGIWIGRAIANVANGLSLTFWFRLGRWKYREV